MHYFHSYRRILIVIGELLLVAFSNYFAFWLRFDGTISPQYLEVYTDTFIWLIVIRGMVFIPFRLYQGLWRYTGIFDLRNIVLAVSISSLAFYSLIQVSSIATTYPISVCIIDSFVLIVFMGGLRLVRRLLNTLENILDDSNFGKRLLIYGAGDAGEMIVRDLQYRTHSKYKPIGFIDDNKQKVGHRIHGVRVLGTRNEISQIIKRHNPDIILIAMPSCDSVTTRLIVQILHVFAISIKTLPNLHDLKDARYLTSQIRDLKIDDLLDRVPVGIDPAPVKALLCNQNIMVTGAGGSIGAELARQILLCQPNNLILIDRYENSLNQIMVECTGKAKNLNCFVKAFVSDVTDFHGMQAIIKRFSPTVIFHAAAYKHVSLMEESPCQAVKNNVTGTRIMTQLAAQSCVKKFILISTDKAVNPASVMGCTKRVAELWIQYLNDRKDHIFSSVRFGNVLGSNGSAVPKFLEQIESGGPVTVTHPDMRRFFMLIPEAIQLVLNAAALAKGKEIYVLEMGKQMKVLDMARNLIRLSGFKEGSIPIQFTGIQAGEKLFEELVGQDEVAEPSSIDQIFRIHPARQSNKPELKRKVLELEDLAQKGDNEGVIAKLCEIVPAYKPSSVYRQTLKDPSTNPEQLGAHQQ